jgi:23S rRNA (uracil1939-C5)-methyltransferase
VGQKLIAEVLRLATEGAGIAVPEGHAGPVIFVPFTSPGDRVEIEIAEIQKNFARARLVKIISTGLERVTPKCSLHFSLERKGSFCGGCNWQHLDYSAQLAHKREIVQDSLIKIGGLKDVLVKETLRSPKIWEYRNKVQIPFGRQSGKIIAGFYEPGSHRIVDFEDCCVQSPLSVRISLKVKALVQELGLPVYDEQSGSGWLRHLLIRSNSRNQALLAFITRSQDFPKKEHILKTLRESFPEIVGIHQNVQPLKTSVILGRIWKKLWGRDAIVERIGPFAFLVSAGSFLQVNTPAAEILYQASMEALASGGRPPLTFDIYCGVGTTTIWASKVSGRVIGIEENPQAVKDAWENSRLNGIKNVRFMTGKAEAVFPRLKREIPNGSAVLCDPPRSGLSPNAARLFAGLNISKIVYISCDPATFSRDAAGLCQNGFRLQSVQPVDLFPQTAHIESIGLFNRA